MQPVRGWLSGQVPTELTGPLTCNLASCVQVQPPHTPMLYWIFVLEFLNTSTKDVINPTASAVRLTKQYCHGPLLGANVTRRENMQTVRGSYFRGKSTDWANRAVYTDSLQSCVAVQPATYLNSFLK